ncbi:MAG: DUF4956 domain-containing protein [Planctomycetes bacterium]|nr:DUF4956 domain-containing protein [Planctomycetota bacterium]
MTAAWMATAWMAAASMQVDGLTEFFHGLNSDAARAAAESVAARLSGAALAGAVVAAVHRLARGGGGRSTASFATTLVLLTMLVALTTIVIGSNLARAFGLVGALSIVRFRTVVEDTRDTAFVIFAVVAGMALGAGEWSAAAVGVTLVAVVALLLARVVDGRSTGPLRRLVVRVAPGRDPAALVAERFADYTATNRLVAAGTARQGAALEAKWDVRLRAPDALLEFVQSLCAIEGVQHAEIEEPGS